MNDYNNYIKNCYKEKKKKIAFITIIFIVIITIFATLLFYFIFNNKEEYYYITLNGEDVILVFEGSSYEEPGFKGFNDKEQNLTSSVIVSSNIDTSTPGNYTITYELNGVKKYRTVKVIPKDKEVLKIELKGDEVICLNINDIYMEAGYTAIDIIDGNITDKIRVSNNININKEGEYKITYNVTNSYGVTTYAYRKVIVKDYKNEINLTLSNNNKTADPLTINIEVTDENFSYLVLPNNTKITNNKYSYDVEKNGTYEFVYYNIYGYKVKKSIDVSNLVDISSVDIETSDNIKSGKLHSVGFQIKLKSDASSIYYCIDNNNSCNPNKKYTVLLTFLETTNKYLRFTSCNNDGICRKPSSYKINLNINLLNPSVSTSTETHQGMANPHNAAYYHQGDNRWKNYYLIENNTNKTMATSGCGYNAFAILLTGLTHNYSITPITLFEKLKNYRTKYNIEFQLNSPLGALNANTIDTHEKLQEEYEYESKNLWKDSTKKITTTEKKEKIIASLKMGHMLFLNVPNHYIALVGINENDEIYIFDPWEGTFLKNVDDLYNTYQNYKNYCTTQGFCGITVAYEVFKNDGKSLESWQ